MPVRISRASKPHLVRAVGSTAKLRPTQGTGPRGPEGPPGPPGQDGAPGGSDASTAAFVADPASDTRAALGVAFASRPLGSFRGLPDLGNVPVVSASPPVVTVGANAAAAPYTGTTLPADTNLVSRRSGRYATQYIDSKNWLQNYINNPSTSRSQGDIEFTFSGTRFAVHVNALLTTGGVRIWVDGQVVSSSAVTVTHNSGTSRSQNWVTVVFSASSVRRIRIEFPASLFGGLNFEAGAAVSPLPTRLPRCAVYGDSWAQGTSDTTIPDMIYSRLGYELGWETARLGQGGSGYVQVGSGAGQPYTNAERLQELGDFKPDFVVVIGSLNDDAYTASAVGTAAAQVYAGIATEAPQARVIVVTPQGTGTAIPASRLANRDAIVTAARDASNVVQVIDPIALDWINAGNAGTYILPDGLHPNTAGANYWANRLATEIARAA